MGLKETLKKLKVKISSSFLPTDRDYEFDTKLEDHQLGEQKIYRLRYINYHRIGESYDSGPNNIGIIDWPFKPFTLPSEMSREEAFKIISYLKEYLERELQLEKNSKESINALDNILDIKRLGFKRANISIVSDESNIIDLFIVTGRILLFKKSISYQKYFNWYTNNVTFEEIQKIYAKYGIEFYDLAISPKEEKNQSKIRELKKK